MKNELSRLNEELGHLLAAYRQVKAELQALDHEIMRRYRRKWHIERQLCRVEKCTAQPCRATLELEELPVDVITKKLELLPMEKLEELLENVQARLHGTGG